MRIFLKKPARIVLWIVLIGCIGIAWPQQPKTIVPFSDSDSLDSLRAKILLNGYHFTVGHNWVYDLSPEMKERFFSRRPRLGTVPSLKTGDIGPLAQDLGKALPASFDWRHANGHSYIGPVRDQGYCGSCYSFGAAAAAEGTYDYAFGLTDDACTDFSESFIMWCLGSLPEYANHFYGCDGADYDYMELQALVDYGVCSEADYPYTIDEPTSCTHWGDPRVSFGAWFRIPCNNINAIKTAIYTYGVVDVAVQAGSAFDAYSGGIYEDSLTSCSGSPCDYTATNHAVSLVGWDDAQQVFILRNSWGASWGENGYMRINYKAAHVACEAAYLVYNYEPPALTVSAPAAGADWSCGSTQTITWTKSGTQAANVKIQLYKGNMMVTTIVPSTPNDGSLDWAIPKTQGPATNYRIRVTTTDNKLSDYSDYFTISKPTIAVTLPAAGMTWTRGTTQTITWTKTGTQNANVKIQLYRGTTLVETISASTPNSGSFDWTIPTTLKAAANYKIKVKTLDGAAKAMSGVFAVH